MMEPITLVVAALAAGATAGLSNAASTIVMDAYQALKTLVLERLVGAGLSDNDGQRLVAGAVDQDSGQVELAEALSKVGVDEPTAEAAQHLLDLLDQQKGKFVVDASQAKGLIVGDNATQHNTFN
jgi:hypothetical protein